MNPIFRRTLGMAATLALLAGPALAQPYQQGPGQEHGPPPGQYHEPQGGYEGHPPGPQHEVYGDGAPHGDDYGPPHGGWHQGDRFDGNRVVVNNWNHHHLHAPPPGYEWVQSGDQFVLIAVTTGIIASIIAASSSPY
jgi:Ni/Co efflux regulator RcnB